MLNTPEGHHEDGVVDSGRTVHQEEVEEEEEGIIVAVVVVVTDLLAVLRTPRSKNL